ncbi:sigma factor-like helix-turn-helix DNA-binding protein [Acidothermaceae bacterium B102]|nr:sigma factor-like helix-turn-helix DNA-binding protein [Acidothermaceae bacterium B102]
MTPAEVEGLLRELTPQALGAVARRYGDFADAEDAVQEALVTAAAEWPSRLPDNPLSWLITVASRRLVDDYRRTDARRRREDLAASLSIHQQEPVPSADDSLVMLFLACDEALSPTLSIPLTLRAVAGLTTREIAAAYLVPEATMAQRISRAKAKLRGRRFELPADPGARLRSVCEVLYLLFNEGYTSSSGTDLTRVDLSGEAIRLARMLVAQAPDDPEVAGLLALMLLTEARRPARTATDGALVPLAEQDRSLWDRALISEGLPLLNASLAVGRIGEYQLLASVAALHDEAVSHAATRWAAIARTYGKLESLTGNPMVRLNRAVAVAMVDGPAAGLELLEGLDLRDSHRLYAVRAHLYEAMHDRAAAASHYAAAAERTNNARERDYLREQAARVNAGRD